MPTHLLLVILVLVATPCLAKRVPAPKVPPMESGGIRYVAPNTNGRTAYVEAWDIRTGRKLWTAKVFTNRIRPRLERDVQWVYIKKLEIVGQRLIATDERGGTHVVDLGRQAPDAWETGPTISVADQAAVRPRLVYVKGNALWSAPLQANGRVASRARAAKLLDLGRLKRDEWVELAASPDGRWLALTREADDSPSSILLDLTATDKGRVHKLAGGEPAFSPDGAQVAYDGVADGSRGVIILTLATGEKRLLRPGVESPFWADDRIAVYGGMRREGYAVVPFLVLDAKTGEDVYATWRSGLAPDPPVLSPNGRYLAFEFHLSRPVVGDTLVDITAPPGTHGEVADLSPPLPRGYAAQKVAAWSRDNREVVWAYLVTDPENDGSWLREDLWLAAPGSSHTRLLVHGRRNMRHTEAQFAPDQKHVLWFQRREDHAGQATSGGRRWRAGGQWCWSGTCGDSQWLGRSHGVYIDNPKADSGRGLSRQ